MPNEMSKAPPTLESTASYPRSYRDSVLLGPKTTTRDSGNFLEQIIAIIDKKLDEKIKLMREEIEDRLGEAINTCFLARFGPAPEGAITEIIDNVLSKHSFSPNVKDVRETREINENQNRNSTHLNQRIKSNSNKQ